MKSVKFIVLVLFLTLMIVGINIGGAKFVNAIQMHFGFKGKIDRLEQCIEMPGCNIGPDDLDFYKKYHIIKESDAVEELMEKDMVEDLLVE